MKEHIDKECPMILKTCETCQLEFTKEEFDRGHDCLEDLKKSFLKS